MSEDSLICPLCSRVLSVGQPVCPNDHGLEIRAVLTSEVERTPRSKRHLLGVTISETYVINGYLGSGGFGAVYKARQTSVGRDVALKLLTTDAVNDATVIERFRREARTAAALLDPNVVTIFDFGETRLSEEAEDHALWIAMELVIGPTLKAVLHDEGCPGLAGAVFTGVNILRGLAAAHRLGVVHRDLKPGNVLIDETKDRPYFARLFDFGIASLQGSGGQTMTMGEGGVLGTPKYMAPEQWRAGRTTPATDVYAFGIMLAEMLLGEPPIPKMELVRMAASHCRGPRPKVERTATDEPVPPALTGFIETCTAIERKDRYASAREALDALERIAASLEEGRPSTRPRPHGAGSLSVGGSVGAASASRRLGLPFERGGASASGSVGNGSVGNGSVGNGSMGGSSADVGSMGSGSFDEPPPPSPDNSGVIDIFDPAASLDVFDPSLSSTPAGRSGERLPPLAPEDDTIAVDAAPRVDQASDAPRPARGLLLPPSPMRTGPVIPPPFGSIDGSGLDRPVRVRSRSSLSAGLPGVRASLPGASGSLDPAESVSLPPLVDFDSVPPDELGPPPDDPLDGGDAAGPVDPAPALSVRADRAAPVRRSMPPAGPPTDEDVVPIPGQRPSTAPPMARPPLEVADAPDPAKPPPARPVWPWTAAAVILLLALLGLRFIGDDPPPEPAPPDPAATARSAAPDDPPEPSPPEPAADATPDARADAARDAAVPDAAPATVAVRRVIPKPKPETKPKPKPETKPKPKPETKPKPKPPAVVKPSPPPPAGNAAAEATYARGIDAKNRGATANAQKLFTQALKQGLSGSKAAEARRLIGQLAEQAAAEEDF